MFCNSTRSRAKAHPFPRAILSAWIAGMGLPSAYAATDEKTASEPKKTMEEIVVTGRTYSDVFRPSTRLSGRALQQTLRSSIPESLASIPGFAVEYNGPGAASPSIRGLAGDRVLMLEDSFRTGDLYWSASDHGVMAEAVTAESIEVVRGPAGLLYGANALGGVVNVRRGDIPRALPDGLTGTVTSQFESVNLGFSQGASVQGAVGPLAFRIEESTRQAGISQTPRGPLEGTDLDALGAAAGVSWLPDWGRAGASFRYYRNNYGVPGEFNGTLIPGGHPGGANVEARRFAGRAGLAYDGAFAGVFDQLEIDGSFTRYLHDEVEGVIDNRRALGAQFEQTTVETKIIARHFRADQPSSGLGARFEGAVGLTFLHQDLLAGGASPGTRSGDAWTLGVFAYEELLWAPLRFQLGFRYDRQDTTPVSNTPIEVRTAERQISKDVSPRTFDSLSGSMATLWEFADRWTLGTSVARSFRAPTLQELYSDGPHLADFSFDIGSPNLAPETGLGIDVFLRAELPALSLEVAAYSNWVNDYIYYVGTGETKRVIREGSRPVDTPVFEAQAVDALFVGTEGRVEWRVGWGVVLDVTASYTRASNRVAEDPLPFIPPLSGRAHLRYEGSVFFGALGVQFAADQNRVPRAVAVGDTVARPQEPTVGYTLFNANAGFRMVWGHTEHTVTTELANITDSVWRDHLSRTKDVAPQPGRNFHVTYRVNF